jgi:hypothetical protein
MEILNRCEEVGDCSTVSAYSRFCSRTYLIRRPGFYLLLLVLAAAASAQIPSQSGNNLDETGTSSDLDCADPLLASSAQCTGQSQYTINPQFPQQYRSALPEEYGTQIQGLRNNYTDTEQLTQQGYGRAQATSNLLPPEPLTEFQKFVASTTGQILPVY